MTRFFSFFLCVSALGLSASATKAPRSLQATSLCNKCIALVDTSEISTDSTEAEKCKWWVQTLGHYAKCARSCSFDAMYPLAKTAQEAVKKCGHPNRLPRLECSECIHNAYSTSENAIDNNDDSDSDNEIDDVKLKTKCRNLALSLNICKKSACHISNNIFINAIDIAQNLTKNLCATELETTVKVSACDRCANEVTQNLTSRTDSNRCEIIYGSIQGLEVCTGKETCKRDFHVLVDKLEDAVEINDGTCLDLNTHDTFDAYQCMSCVRGDLNETFLEEETNDEDCDSTERELNALQVCSETKCVIDSRPLEARLETLQEYLEDGKCSLDIDDLPFAQCYRCVQPFMSSIDSGEELSCPELSGVTTEVAKCDMMKCVRDRRPLSDALDRLREMAGGTCHLLTGKDENKYLVLYIIGAGVVVAGFVNWFGCGCAEKDGKGDEKLVEVV